MKYKEVQKKAKELGISPIVGVSQEDLEKAIKEKTDSIQLNTAENNKNENIQVKPKNDEAEPEQEYNIAIVMKGSREVRRYTVENHGEDFEKLANEFAKSSGYTVKLTTAKQGITCPSCNHVFSL